MLKAVRCVRHIIIIIIISIIVIIIIIIIIILLILIIISITLSIFLLLLVVVHGGNSFLLRVIMGLSVRNLTANHKAHDQQTICARTHASPSIAAAYHA